MTVSATTADGRARVLADGNQMPVLGLGIWQVPNGAASVDAVRWALDLGYRHQVQFSPQRYRRALLDACLRRNVAAEAYSPLGTGRNLSDVTVNRVAQHVGRTPAQVLLRWNLQRGPSPARRRCRAGPCPPTLWQLCAGRNGDHNR